MRAILFVIACVLALSVVGAALAVDPGTRGQPGQSCQAENGLGPAGLVSTTNGFARVAVVVYAGSLNTPSLANGNAHAVSQYDVACFQVAQQSH